MTQIEIENALSELTARIGVLERKVLSVEQENIALKLEAGRKSTLEEAELILSTWTKTVDTQMHFNEMVMKVRSLAITLLLASFGAAAYSLQTPQFLTVSGRPVHVAAFIIAFGLVGWVALAVVDLQHFHKLLRGTVAFGMRLEKIYKEHIVLGPLLGMTTAIAEESRTFLGMKKIMGFKATAGKKIAAFYFVVLIAGVSFFFIALNYIDKSELTKEQVLKIVTDNGNGMVLRVEPPTLLLKEERVQEVQKLPPRPKGKPSQ
jgi:hypothetical protein